MLEGGQQIDGVWVVGRDEMRGAAGCGQLRRKTRGQSIGAGEKFNWNIEELRDMRGQDDII